MSNAEAIDPTQASPKISPQMRAVLAIFSYDHFLMEFIGKAVDFENDSVDWDEIFAASLNAGQHAACLWAFSLWRDELRGDYPNMFEAALSMDTNLKTAVLRALRMRWGLQR